MLALALDTATGDLVAGVGEVAVAESAASTDAPGARLLAEMVESTRAHNERLVPACQKVLAEAGATFSDVDAIVVGCGPGPFTGLRVGMATASAFGQALGVPVYGVVTHDAVATQLGGGSVLVVTDARRREVYWAHYVDGRRVAGPAVCAPGALPVSRVDVLSVPEHLAPQVEVDAGARTYAAPRTLGLLAAADFGAPAGPLVPHYLRRPDAVEPKATPLSPAIPPVAR